MQTTSDKRFGLLMNNKCFWLSLLCLSVYAIPLVLLSFLVYRKGLPLTMRTCLYPILGAKTFGRIGDLVDMLAIIIILLGANLGLKFGTQSLSTRIHYKISTFEDSIQNQIFLLWIMIGAASISVLLGLKIGIRRLSNLAISLGITLLMIVFFSDNLAFILKVIAQCIGWLIKHLITISLHTAPFSEVNNFLNATTPTEATLWKHNDTVLYATVLLSKAWCMTPMVGLFTARLSKRRTIGEVIKYTMFFPALFGLVWFATFGGLVIDMQHEAMKAGITRDVL